MDLTQAMQMGFIIEATGGGCEWLRRGRLAITDGDAGIPGEGDMALLLTLDEAGDYADADSGHEFPSLRAALAFVESCERIYGSRNE